MIRINRHTLPNGLRIVHNHDPNSAMVCVNTLYNVGSRDEKPDRTGLAHLFEHLMFGGSVNVPHFDKAIESAGGVNNAWTSPDFTNFYDILPSVNFETALWLESDRMLSPSLSDRSIDIQRNVVIEEFKQVCLNQPYGDLWHHIRHLAFEGHPYEWPTIGLTPQHVADATRADVADFFFTHYAPNNAVLAVSGNVDFDTVCNLARKWYGSIPRREIAPRTYTAPAPITSPRELTVHGAVPQPSLTLAFPMPARSEEGYIECDLITDILSSGQSSRFFRNLFMKNRLFSSADAFILGSEEPGLLLLSAKLTSSRPDDIDTARRLLINEAMELASKAPDEHELLRAQNRFDSTYKFGSLSVANKAFHLALTTMQGIDINTIVHRYRAVTTEDILHTARAVFNPQRLISLTYLPNQS